MREYCLLSVVPSLLAAQMPGVPVLQNAWATPGIVGAVDLAGGSGSSVWAAALSWSPGTGRMQFSGGAGTQSISGNGSRGVYGARVAVPLRAMMGGKLGVAGFAGVGGGAATTSGTTVSSTVVPVGLGIGYRQSMGTRGASIYGTPSYQWTSGGGASSSAFRMAFGLDVGLARNIGVTGGLEFGSGSKGAGGTTYAGGASYAFGHR